METKTTFYVYKGQSLRSQLLRRAFSMFKRFIKVGKPGSADRLKKRSDRPVPPARLLRGIDLHNRKLGGRNVFMLCPTGAKPKKQLLFFHGGGYVLNFSYFHWKLIAAF